MPDLDLAATNELIEDDTFIIRPVTPDDVEDFFRLTRTRNALSPVPFEVMPSRDAAWMALMQYLAKSSHYKAWAAMDKRGRLEGIIYLTLDVKDRKALLSWLFQPVLDRVASALRLFIASTSGPWSRRLEVMVTPGESASAGILLDLGFKKEATLMSYIFRNQDYHDVWLFTRLV
jgi:RimJ/RimL family protein N-acetyltransferase